MSQARCASHHFHPGASNRDELPLCHVVLNLGIESRVPAPHPFELLCLSEHRIQPQLPPRCSTPMFLLSGTTQDPGHPHLIWSHTGEAACHKQKSFSVSLASILCAAQSKPSHFQSSGLPRAAVTPGVCSDPIPPIQERDGSPGSRQR